MIESKGTGLPYREDPTTDHDGTDFTLQGAEVFNLASLDELYPPSGQLPPPGGLWVAQPGGLGHHRDDTSDLILSVNPNDTCFDDPDARPTGDRTTSLAPNTASGFADLDD